MKIRAVLSVFWDFLKSGLVITDSLLQTQDSHAISEWMKLVSHLHVTLQSLDQEVLHFPFLSLKKGKRHHEAGELKDWLDMQHLKETAGLYFFVKCSAILLLPCRTFNISSVCCTAKKAEQLKLHRKRIQLKKLNWLLHPASWGSHCE